MSDEKFLRRPEVMERVGYRCSTIYALMKKGEFPQAYQLGPRAVGWRLSDIDGWIESRLRKDSQRVAA